MKLVQIAKGRWEVVAVADPEGRCEVLDLLDEAGPGYAAARRFLSVFLRVYLPLEGPPTCHHRLCKPLGDGIFELRQPEGTKPNALFFRGEKGRIVCTLAAGKEVLTSEVLDEALTGELT